MKYTVSINEKKRAVTVTLADGSKGTARCCPTDLFNVNTGIELALERAKVAKTAKAAKTAPATPATPATPASNLLDLVKAVEKALPKGQAVLIGAGDKLTEEQREWLLSIAGVKPCKCGGSCNCNCEEDEDEAYDNGYDDGYAEGYQNGHSNGYDQAMHEVDSNLDDLAEELAQVDDELQEALSALEQIYRIAGSIEK